jgi:hypothetical protein
LPSEEHERCVDHIVKTHKAEKSGFMKAVISAMRKEDGSDREIERDLKKMCLLPDAYRLDVIDERLVISTWEVEKTARIVNNRLSIYSEWWWITDCASVFFKLTLVDERTWKESRLDLMNENYRRMLMDVGRKEDAAKMVLYPGEVFPGDPDWGDRGQLIATPFGTECK